MIEKRFNFREFEITANKLFINNLKLYEIDNNPSDDLDFSNLFVVYSESKENIEFLVHKLNELSDENDKLKSMIGHDVKEENEKLKQEIDSLRRQLTVYRKIKRLVKDND